MTAAQRLRLVLALGVINLVLASVALGIGITGAPFATPGIAVVEPSPSTPSGAGSGGQSPSPNPTSPTIPEATGRPGGPGPLPSAEPTAQPTPTATEVSPNESIEPSPSAVPSEVPVSTPTVAATTPEPVLAGNPGTNPPTGGGEGGGSGPRPTPTPTPKPTARPTPTPTPVVNPRPKPPNSACHASPRGIEASRGKACGVHGTAHPNKPERHKANTRAHQQADRRPAHAQPATVESKRRNRASRHRLRRGHRPQ